MAAAGGFWDKSRAGVNTGQVIFVTKQGAKAWQTETGLPENLTGLQQVAKLGGSTGARLMADDQGNKYVVKKGNSPEHLLEETYADQAYKNAGFAVPTFKLYAEGPTKVAKFVGDAKPLGDVINTPEGKAAVRELRKGFAMDALLGNWDVIGMGMDNVLVGKGGTPYRIDNGGSLRFRARGAPKGGAWNEKPGELWTMRHNDQTTGKVYGSLKLGEVLGQVPGLTGKRAVILSSFPKELRPAVSARLKHMSNMAGAYKKLAAQGHQDAAIDDFFRSVYTGKGQPPKTAAELVSMWGA